MQAPYDWPLILSHPKCDSDEIVVVQRVSVRSTGVLVFQCYCLGCRDEFEIKKNMLELTAEAYVNDRDLIGTVPHTEYQPRCTKPN